MLHIHRAERADGLIEALCALLAQPQEDPFAPEVVCVPTRGMERWLTQRMAGVLGASPGRGDGVCANVAFPSPRRLAEEAVAVAAGSDPEIDAWLPERMVWPLLEVVDAAIGEAWLRPLASYLGAGEDAAGTRRARRFASVRHVADLLDRYALSRPAMLRAWAEGRDVDASGRPLGADCAWQAELWRRLRGRAGQADPAERIDVACARIREQPQLLDLPPRLSLFGLTRLPAGRLRVFEAIAAGRDVHLFLLHPSPALWAGVAATGASGGRRRADPTRELPANPLLASWGHDVRELQLVVGGGGEDHHHPTAPSRDTLLARIQADVRADRRPPGPPLPGREDGRLELARGDRSVQVHACHGRGRQVEVLRDAVLHLLAADPTLEPRDVIVMCPDIETFAPLIHATFGAGEVSADDEEAVAEDLRPPDLRVRLADRSLRQTNPVLGVIGRLLELADERLTASQVLDLADREPVRRRFGVDDDAVTRLEEWVAESGIRWGLDAEHRAPFKLDGLPAGTWRAGLDRVLLGVAMTEDEHRLFGGVLPLDDVESGAIDLAGRLAELIDRLQAALDAMRAPMAVAGWAAAIGAAADALTAVAPRDAWQRAQVQRVLDGVVAEADITGASDIALSLPEVRELLADRLQGRPTRTNFRTGHLTICTLVPMRSVPHRVVCLLGLDDGEFPRRAIRDGDDLLLRDPHVGDRDARMEDRQMLLDALMAATDRLVVTYTGRDERTNTPRPPAVPVGELLDVVDATARCDRGRARDRVLVEHPLQPFDPRNFAPGELVPGRPWGFDRTMLDGAVALAGERAAPVPFLGASLPPLDDDVVELEDLVRFAQRPVRTFLRRRLGVSVAEYADDPGDALPVELDGLDRWGVGERILQARLAGADRRRAVLAEIARGTLPPGVLGKPEIERIEPQVDGIVAHAQRLVPAGAGSVDVRVALGDRVLSGTVAGVAGDVLRTVTYSRVNARHRIAAWVRLLALTASHPGRPFEAVTIGRAREGAAQAEISVARIPPLDAGEAREQLAIMLDLYARGMREPLPLYGATSAAWAQARRAGGEPERAARAAWESPWNFDKEDREPEHALVRGGVVALEELLAEPPRAGEDWALDEPSRFGRYARRLWDGLLAREQVTDT